MKAAEIVITYDHPLADFGWPVLTINGYWARTAKEVIDGVSRALVQLGWTRSRFAEMLNKDLRTIDRWFTKANRSIGCRVSPVPLEALIVLGQALGTLF